MRYSIAFKNLPFDPEKRQVVYVENQYDERINAVIKRNYEQIKWTFKQANLDFVYLPMFFNDEETKEKILYYAPYLTSDIMEKAELRSSHLLKYMSHMENQEMIAPSLLYVPKKDEDEWIFQGQTIEIDGDDTNTVNQWFDHAIYDIEEELSSDQMTERRYDEDLDDIESRSQGEPHVEPQVEYSSKPSIWDKIKEAAWQSKKLEEYNDESRSSLEKIREEDVSEIIADLERDVKKLRLRGISLTSIIQLIEENEIISRLYITDDYRLFLPDYNNMEVKMSPQYKAVYLLFLNHPEGIILKQLETYHIELENRFKQVFGYKVLPPKEVQRINTLEYPGNNQISVVLTRIRESFERCIDKHLAKHYLIAGRAGGLYKLQLKEELIEFEEEYE